MPRTFLEAHPSKIAADCETAVCGLSIDWILPAGPMSTDALQPPIERKLNLRELPADQSTLPCIRGWISA